MKKETNGEVAYEREIKRRGKTREKARNETNGEPRERAVKGRKEKIGKGGRS